MKHKHEINAGVIFAWVAALSAWGLLFVMVATPYTRHMQLGG
jgi:hypothetical protein